MHITDRIDIRRLAALMVDADDVIVIAVHGGRMRVAASNPDAASAIANVAVASNMLVGALTDAMFTDSPQLDG